MIYRVAICDDSAVDAAYIRNLFHEWANQRQLLVHTELFASSEQFLFRYAEEKSFDLLLLDIEMSGMDGVTMAKRLRKDNETIQIVFITGYAEYISEGYDVAALHYLIKPIDKKKLFSVLDKAIDKKKQNERSLLLCLSAEMVRIPYYEIRYLDVQQNYVTVHAKRDYTVKRPLAEIEKELDSRFHRVGRSLLLNLQYIRRVTKNEVFLTDSTVLHLPRGAYEPLNRAIITNT